MTGLKGATVIGSLRQRGYILRNSIFLSLSLAAILWSVPHAAHARQDETVAQAATMISAQKGEQAYRLLLPQMDQRAGDPDYDYVLGLAAADSGRPAEAIVAFQRVLSVQPDNAQARAELARAYALAGDIDTARAQFDTVVQDPSLPDPVRQRFDRIVRDYDRNIAGGGTDITGFADISVGLDSNVNAATDLTQITIPLFAAFGPGALAPGARAQDDGFFEAVAGISAVAPLSRQTRLFGSVLGNWRDNFDSRNRAFDQAALTGSAGLAHTLPSRDVLSLSGQVQQFWYGHDSYRQAYGAIGQYTHRLKGGEALSVSGEFFITRHERDTLRDSQRYGISVAYAARDFILSAGGGHEEADARAGDHFSNDYVRASVGFEKPLAPRLSVVGGLTGQLRRHDAADPLFLDKRKDEQVDASLGLKVRISDALYARPRVSYTRNWSNIALYDYERATVSLGIRAEF